MHKDNPLYRLHKHERRERMRYRFSIIASLVFVAALVAFLLWALYQAITLPIVYTSYATGYCVTVDDVRGVYTCENLPRKFHHVWQP